MAEDTSQTSGTADGGGAARLGGVDASAAIDTGVHSTLGIRLIEASPERVIIEMPVTPKVHQPYGIMHGGVSALLAESAASIGSGISVTPGHKVVGIELNASHLRAIRQGVLRATATPARKGRTVHVWNISLTDDTDRRICEARCTLAVIAP